MIFKWTDENIQKLKKMLANGKSAREIAEELGGISRNSVIGKAHRLGISAQNEKKKTKTASPSKEVKKKAESNVKPIKQVIHISQATPRSSENSCQWPIGDPGTSEFKFCYEPAKQGRPYCNEHCNIAYRKIK